MNQHFIHRTETTNQNSKINHDDSKTLTQILFSAMAISQNSLTETGMELGKAHNRKVIENFETFPESINTPSSDQRFRNYGH
jgi:fructose-1-phosphate kinase PfkB-like protein